MPRIARSLLLAVAGILVLAAPAHRRRPAGPARRALRGRGAARPRVPYPDGLAGKEIPLGAQIVAVCDAFHAMTSERPYSRSLSVQDAVAELRRCAGTQFDPDVVDLFCAGLGVTAPAAAAERPRRHRAGVAAASAAR